MKIGIFDATTQENTERDMTANELADYEAHNADYMLEKNAKEIAELQAEADKAAILAKIGLTADEAKLLLS
jgi:hypothetical protein